MKSVKVLCCWVCLLFTCLKTYSQEVFPKEVKVCLSKTTLLVFPANIKNADRGSASIEIGEISKVSNVLRIKASEENFIPTNVSVFTDDGRIYSFNVSYTSDIFKNIYDFAVSDANQYADGGLELSQKRVRQIAGAIQYISPTSRKPMSSNGNVTIRLKGVYLAGGKMFFRFGIHNGSAIPFDVDFCKFFIADRTRSKRTSHMEKEILSTYSNLDSMNAVPPDADLEIVTVFEKFTIADGKKFHVEFFEKSGDRHLKISIKGKHLLKCKPVDNLVN
ncbi:conjugative transposon protein TraN [Chitinophaga eiseniae]|uniref:Conjugative transposon protein TraN n=1 Tax=Chitinophaga eiseniae TaxID=634771 RepID=A0A847S3Z7_9BACT|nr:conjugative transposon protein TraN [Chitinophaga eiseniae]NLR78020.1 conjugative transposon protein TraN [Chitinophaga eiseniae]